MSNIYVAIKTFVLQPFESPRSLGDARSSESGLAILIAILVVSIIFTFSSDLVITSRVNVENAIRHRDNVKAEYMTKSGVNLGLFVLGIDFGIDLFLASDKSPQKTPMSDSLGDLWSAVNGLPIGGATLEMLGAAQEGFGLNAVLDDKVIGTLKKFDGEFVVEVSDESSKININYCAKGTCLDTLAMIEALLSCPVEQEFISSKDIDSGTFAYLIKDYIDSDNRASSQAAYNDENSPYQNKTPSYKVKNAPFDSLSELKMIDGWDDQLHEVFSDYFTIYPIQETSQDRAQINLNTASREMLRCLFPDANKECPDAFAIGLKERGANKTAIAASSADLSSTMSKLFCYDAKKTPESSDKKRWFGVQSKVFKISVTGEVGDQTKKIEVFMERVIPKLGTKQTKAYKLYEWRLL
jgi:type II secretory pathway component PulK